MYAEFHDEKDYKKRGGPPRATGYEKAIWALEDCSEKYEHPKELLKLNGIGPTCVKRYVQVNHSPNLGNQVHFFAREQMVISHGDRLTEKLEEYCDRRGIPMPEYKPRAFALSSDGSFSLALDPIPTTLAH